MITRGFQYGYVYKEVRGIDNVLKAVPLKNPFSHPHDALQYLMLHAMGMGGALRPQHFSREGHFAEGMEVRAPRKRAEGWT